MSAVLNWVRANAYTVIFVAIMIAAPVALWVVAGRMNSSVRADVEKRAAKLPELSRLEKTPVRLENPVAGNTPVNATVVVNRQLLDRYREVAGQIRQDADRIRQEALEHNGKGRGVLLPELFPQPPAYQVETIPVEMYRALDAAYRSLLTEVRAGAPPSEERMREAMQAAEERFRTQILMKGAGGELTADENAWLQEQLATTRLSSYADAARQIAFYAQLDGLDVPSESERPARADSAGLIQMFDWQWDYWIAQDIVRALADANASYGSVVEGPVKGLESLYVADVAAAADAGAPAGGGAPTGAGFGPAGGGKRKGESAPSGQPAGAPLNPGREVPRDYSVSFTGRTSNPLYDVRIADVVVLADTAKIPEVFDALARQNFMTVLDASVEAVDLYDAVASGFYYGAAPVSRLTMRIETIWLREWTSPFMPAEVKQALGIPVQAPKT